MKKSPLIETSQINTSSIQPRLGYLALELFGSANGVELDLPQQPPYKPLEFAQFKS